MTRRNSEEEQGERGKGGVKIPISFRRIHLHLDLSSAEVVWERAWEISQRIQTPHRSGRAQQRGGWREEGVEGVVLVSRGRLYWCRRYLS